MAKLRELRGEERWAAACVRATLPGVTVAQHDDNTVERMHDLALSLGGRTFGAMEVTFAADRELVRGWDHVPGLDKRWIVDGLVGGWDIVVRKDVRRKRLLRGLPPLLLAMEQAGWTFLSSPVVPDELRARAAELGVIWARQGSTDFAGSIYPTLEIPPERSGGVVPMTGDALSEWVSEWMLDPSGADNLDKLRRSGATERHLFVIVPGFVTTAPFEVSDLLMRPDAPLPTASPELPPEITHIWIVGRWVNGHGFRWSPERGWERFANLVVPHHP